MTASWLQAARQDPVEFRRQLKVQTPKGAEFLGDIVEDWQEADFRALDHGWRCAALMKVVDDPFLRAYLERGRGHSKTTDIAVMSSWCLIASEHPIKGCVAAGDKDQAGLTREAVEILLSINPWLNHYLEVKKWTVVNKHTGAMMEILATDASGNYGMTRDFILVDELTHWGMPKHFDNWEMLYSTAGKLPHCMVVVIANAGLGEGRSWQWHARELARTGDDPAGYRWHFSRLDGPRATWITKRQLADQQRMLSDSAYRRLWLNLWQPGEGDALDAALVEAAICREMSPDPLPGYTHIGGFDAGITSDHAAWVVMAVREHDPVVHVLRVRDWAPNRPVGAGGKLEVDLTEVQDTIRADMVHYGMTAMFYDPTESRLAAQQLRKEGINAQEVNFTGKNLNAMARALLVAFREKRIQLYNDRLLVNDLMRLTIEEKPFGMRLSATRDENGHADRATALAIVLPVALQISELPPRFDDRLGNTLNVGY